MTTQVQTLQKELISLGMRSELAELFANYLEGQTMTGNEVWIAGAVRTVYQITPANIATGATDTSLITAPAAGYIRILSLSVQIGNIATNVTIKSKVGPASSTAISPAWEFGANGGIVLDTNMAGAPALKDAELLAAITVTTSGSAATTHITGTYAIIT